MPFYLRDPKEALLFTSKTLETRYGDRIRFGIGDMPN